VSRPRTHHPFLEAFKLHVTYSIASCIGWCHSAPTIWERRQRSTFVPSVWPHPDLTVSMSTWVMLLAMRLQSRFGGPKSCRDWQDWRSNGIQTMSSRITTPCLRTIPDYYPFAFFNQDVEGVRPVDSLLLELRLMTRIASGGRVSDCNVVSRYQKLVYSESESWSVLDVYIHWSYLGSSSSLGYLHMRTVQRPICKETWCRSVRIPIC